MQCVCITLCASDAPGPDWSQQLWEHIYALEARPATASQLHQVQENCCFVRTCSDDKEGTKRRTQNLFCVQAPSRIAKSSVVYLTVWGKVNTGRRS